MAPVTLSLDSVRLEKDNRLRLPGGLRFDYFERGGAFG